MGLRYVVTRRGARQYDDDGGYLQLGERRFRAGDEVPRDLVDRAANKNRLLDLDMVQPVFDDDAEQVAHDRQRRARRKERQGVE